MEWSLLALGPELITKGGSHRKSSPLSLGSFGCSLCWPWPWSGLGRASLFLRGDLLATLGRHKTPCRTRSCCPSASGARVGLGFSTRRRRVTSRSAASPKESANCPRFSTASMISWYSSRLTKMLPALPRGGSGSCGCMPPLMMDLLHPGRHGRGVMVLPTSTCTEVSQTRTHLSKGGRISKHQIALAPWRSVAFANRAIAMWVSGASVSMIIPIRL